MIHIVLTHIVFVCIHVMDTRCIDSHSLCVYPRKNILRQELNEQLSVLRGGAYLTLPGEGINQAVTCQLLEGRRGGGGADNVEKKDNQTTIIHSQVADVHPLNKRGDGTDSSLYQPKERVDRVALE